MRECNKTGNTSTDLSPKVVVSFLSEAFAATRRYFRVLVGGGLTRL